MLTAVDTLGNVYFALTIVNTDEEVFKLLIAQLLNKLYDEDPNYRERVVLQIDGASYHKTPMIRTFLSHSGVDFILNAGYSYSASCCEYFFGAFKKVALNPTMMKTGKR